MNNDKDCNSFRSFGLSIGCSDQSFGELTTKLGYNQQQLGAKVEIIYSLLSMLGRNNRNDMSKTLLDMSSTPESCLAMRQSGCLPLLVQLIHSPDLDVEVRNRAAEALQNIVKAQTDENKRIRESRVLELLQSIRQYCDELKDLTGNPNVAKAVESDKHPLTAVEELMKYSFDVEHRQVMCTLGGLHALVELIQLDHDVHGSINNNQFCIILRRYAGMSLTNLSFGDGNNKTLLCSFNKFMKALVSQLLSPSEDLRQVTASVLRNLSWRADAESKQVLREIGAVTALTIAAMEENKESTLKSMLSALGNLSAHCSSNKVDVCAVPGAVEFLVKMLRYKASSNSLSVVENAGGILRNVSSHIAVREDYRQILRDNNCFEILIEQLKSPSLTVVSNACGTLWNLSARCLEDQRKLWEMGAINILRSLMQSEHKMISMGSSAALKNLLIANSNGKIFNLPESTTRNFEEKGIQKFSSFSFGKVGTHEQERDVNLFKSYVNMESSHSQQNLKTKLERKNMKLEKQNSSASMTYNSHEVPSSTLLDSKYEAATRLLTKNNALHTKKVPSDNETHVQTERKIEKESLVKRYEPISTPIFKKCDREKSGEKSGIDNLVPGNGKKEVPMGKTLESAEKHTIPALKSRMKNETEMQDRKNNCRQPFSGKDYGSQYEEEFPVNYSLKYSESEVYGTKIINEFSENSKEELKDEENYEEYPNYAETDLDQPTDFSLKYGEETSSDEESESGRFHYFEGEKAKESAFYGGQTDLEDTTRTYCTEGTPYDGTPFNFSISNSMSDLRVAHIESKENVPCQQIKGENKKFTLRISQDFKSADDSPLMFSRNSSLNSLSSFEEVNQTIMDDRSSVISDFSPMTSGMISPSELPDSPTQTIPPSPKDCKSAIRLPSKILVQKKAINTVDNGALSSFKTGGGQKESLIETNLNSFAVETALKRHFNVKGNSSTSVIVVNDSKVKKELHHNSPVKSSCILRKQMVPEEPELPHVTKLNEHMSTNCLNNVMQETSGQSMLNQSKQFGRKNGDACLPSRKRELIKKPNSTEKCNQVHYQCESNKIFSACGESDDIVHTYCTEGTPANVSHAGSHSDLSSLTMISGGLLISTTLEEATTAEYQYSENAEQLLAKCILTGVPKEKSDYWTGDENTELGKEGNSGFAIENSPCDLSLRSSLNDLNANSLDSPICFSGAEANTNETSLSSPMSKLVSQCSSNSSATAESEEVDQTLEEKAEIYDVSEQVHNDYEYFEVSEKVKDDSKIIREENHFSSNTETISSGRESRISLNAENYYSSELTPLEQALLEQCIISGMPHKNNSKKSDSRSCQALQSFEGKESVNIEDSEINEADINLNSVRKTNSPDHPDALPEASAENGLFDSSADYSTRNILSQPCENDDPVFDNGSKLNSFPILPSLNRANVKPMDSSGICPSSLLPESGETDYYRKNLDEHLPNTSSHNCEEPKILNSLPVKKLFQTKYSEEHKIFSASGECDDVVHTYCTEGTPANVSHAGSHSDLSSLNLLSAGAHAPAILDEVTEDGYQYSEDTEKILAACILSGMPKAKHKKSSTDNSGDFMSNKRRNLNLQKLKTVGVPVINSDLFTKNQPNNEFLPRKDNHLSAKDEISTFATENSPCNFSLTSSLSDLTVNSLDSSGCISRAEINRHEKAKLSSRALPDTTGSPVCFIGKDDGTQSSEENRSSCRSQKFDPETKFWGKRNL